MIKNKNLSIILKYFWINLLKFKKIFKIVIITERHNSGTVLYILKRKMLMFFCIGEIYSFEVIINFHLKFL